MGEGSFSSMLAGSCVSPRTHTHTPSKTHSGVVLRLNEHPPAHPASSAIFDQHDLQEGLCWLSVDWGCSPEEFQAAIGYNT